MRQPSLSALVACALLAGCASVAMAGDVPAAPAAPADRAAVQRDTKNALTETKLPDEDMGPLFTEMEAVMRDYSRWVLDVGPTTAAEEDAEDVAREQLEPLFQARAVALSGQSALIELAATRIEAIRAHAERIREDQAKVKAEINDANLGDAELDGAVLQAALAFADQRFTESAFPGRASDTRPSALDLAKAELLPIIQHAELPAKNAERMCAAVADWMNALSLLEDEAKLRGTR